MTHSMMFAEDYLDFDRDEAEAEYRSALPATLGEVMTKAEIIEKMAEFLANASGVQGGAAPKPKLQTLAAPG